MKKLFSDKKNDILIKQRNISFLISAILLIILLLQAIALCKKDTKTILVPFDFNSKITISSKKASNEYLEAMSRDIIYTMLNLTPNNMDYAEKTILSFANANSYGTLKNQFEKIKKSILSRKFSTAFYPVSIYPNNSNMKVVIEGVLCTFLGEKEVARVKKKYQIDYQYKAGKLSIVGFSDITDEEDSNKQEK